MLLGAWLSASSRGGGVCVVGGLGVVGDSTASGRSEMRNLVRRATTYMCLQDEWCFWKKSQVQLFTVPSFSFWIWVTLMMYVLR